MCLSGLWEIGNHRSGLLWTAVHGLQRGKLVAESQKQDLPADGLLDSMQTEATSQVLCGAPSYTTGTDKVQFAGSSSLLLNSICHSMFFHAHLFQLVSLTRLSGETLGENDE